MPSPRRPLSTAAVLAAAVALAAPSRAAAPPPVKSSSAGAPSQASPKAPAVKSSSAHGVAPTRVVTWAELVREAEHTNPLMRSARAGLDSFAAQLGRADWAYFPSFKLEAGGTIVPQVTGNALHSASDTSHLGYLFSVNVKMVLPLYTFGKILSLRRAARAGVRVGNAQVDAARWEIRYRAAQAWYGVLLARELQVILDDGEGWLKKAEERMIRLRDQDSDDYDQNEHLRLRSRLADFYQLAANNRELTVQSQQGLRLLLSQPPELLVVPNSKHLDPLPITLLPVERYVAEALKHEPTLCQARAAAAAKRALHDAKKADLLPSFVLLADATIADSNVITDQPSSFAVDTAHAMGASALLGIRWNLDVPNRIWLASQAGANARKATQDASAQALQVEFKVRDLYQQLQNRTSLIKRFAASQKAAQGWLMANWDLYDDGFGEFRDVMDALVQFYSKKVAYLQVVYEHNVLIYELSRAVGADITELSAAADPSPGATPTPARAALPARVPLATRPSGAPK